MMEDPKKSAGDAKPSMSYVPMEFSAELGLAMEEGGIKYGRFNWRETGVVAETYFDALMRHINAWRGGEVIDPDSGLPHLVKAAATLAVLRDAEIQGVLHGSKFLRASPEGWSQQFLEVAADLKSKALKRKDANRAQVDEG